MQLYKDMDLYYMHKSNLGKRDTMGKKWRKLEFGSQEGNGISIVNDLEMIIY